MAYSRRRKSFRRGKKRSFKKRGAGSLRKRIGFRM